MPAGNRCNDHEIYRRKYLCILKRTWRIVSRCALNSHADLILFSEDTVNSVEIRISSFPVQREQLCQVRALFSSFVSVNALHLNVGIKEVQDLDLRSEWCELGDFCAAC